MTKIYSIAEARNRFTSIIRDAETSPPIEITRHGETVAVILSWQERARLVARGQTPPFADGQIAAVAKVNDLVLVTFNESDFHIFNELQIQDWRHAQ